MKKKVRPKSQKEKPSGPCIKMPPIRNNVEPRQGKALQTYSSQFVTDLQ